MGPIHPRPDSTAYTSMTVGSHAQVNLSALDLDRRNIMIVVLRPGSRSVYAKRHSLKQIALPGLNGSV